MFDGSRSNTIIYCMAFHVLLNILTDDPDDFSNLSGTFEIIWPVLI